MTLVLFDGYCNLCNAAVDFLIRRDREGLLRFASLQSATGRRVVAEAEAAGDARLPDSLVVVQDGRVLVNSDAALAALAALPRWRWLARALRWLWQPFRDFVYQRIARVRYSVFGRRATCRVPTPEERARFVDPDPVEP